jgi:hypothetical protein
VSDPRDPRTLRQRLVVEIGDAGQARISAARAVVHGEGLAAEVERRYLAGAAFDGLDASREAPASAIVEALAKATPGAIDPSAAAVIEGSARALAQIRDAAGVAR